MIRKLEHYPFLKLKTNSREEMYSRRAHSHKECSLGYILSGKTTIKVLGQEYGLIPGDMVLIPSDTVHICIPENQKDFRFEMLYFQENWWTQNIHRPSDDFLTLARPAPEGIKKIFQKLQAMDSAPEELADLLATTLNDLIRPLGTRMETKSSREIEKIHNMMKTMPQVSVSVEELAADCRLNKYSFIRKYAARYGLTPHADLINMRIQRATLLFESDMDLTTISQECGFSDQSHFIKQFKLYSGLRPQEYREAIKKGNECL